MLNRCFSNLIDILQRHQLQGITLNAVADRTDPRLLIPRHSFSHLAIKVYHYSFLVPHFDNLIRIVVDLGFDPPLGSAVDSLPSIAPQKLELSGMSYRF